MRRVNIAKKKIYFTFNEKSYEAYEGDSIATALLVNGIMKNKKVYGQESYRGSFCMMGVCYECMVQVEGKSVQGCMYEIQEGMSILEKEL